MRLDGNRSLRNLKFYFEIEIFSQYKVSVLIGGLIHPPAVVVVKYPLGMVNFQDGYLSKELINTLKRMVEPNMWKSLKHNYIYFFPFLTY